MKKLAPTNYTKDSLYGPVVQAVSRTLATRGFVAPVDVLLHLRRITKQQYEDWRFGRVPYLERLCHGSLGKLGRILRIIELHARSLGLTASQTVYHKWGRGGKRTVLRFSKSGHPNLEAAYSRHYFPKSVRADGQSHSRLREHLATAQTTESETTP
jgi:hypothetical protein